METPACTAAKAYLDQLVAALEAHTLAAEAANAVVISDAAAVATQAQIVIAECDPDPIVLPRMQTVQKAAEIAKHQYLIIGHECSELRKAKR